MRHFVSVRVTKHGKFRKTHFAQINAPDEAEALRHLENRCKPGGEYARKFPGATFADFQVTPQAPDAHETIDLAAGARSAAGLPIDVGPIREAREQLLERLEPTFRRKIQEFVVSREVDLVGGPLDGQRRPAPDDNFIPGETIVFQGWFGHIAYDIASAQLAGNGPLRYEYSGPFEG